MNDNRGVFGVNIGHLWGKIELLRGWMEQVLEWEALGKIHPVVDRCVPLRGSGGGASLHRRPQQYRQGRAGAVTARRQRRPRGAQLRATIFQ